MPPTLPSSSRRPATRGVRHTFCPDTDSSTSSAIGDQAAFVNSSREDEDAAATRFKDGRTPSPRSPEVVSGSEDEPTWDSVCLDVANGYHNGTDSSGAMCRICHEGDQKAELVSPCSCSGTIGFVHVSCIEH
ncbi:E3 ubiquitin-protein ligase MARCHF1-like [Rhipicephalus sanguineus]|uniref:E3 ubiquitin-protein ligase MARCHF1-like n=1 Tax=Rhipicephalus sanguineus TaxID=34632 RepID=UPI0018946F02|nr:E3 ubiquitin-protein ligase MARCHF1-like [Rhipicephalus sanguineus]